VAKPFLTDDTISNISPAARLAASKANL